MRLHGYRRLALVLGAEMLLFIPLVSRPGDATAAPPTGDAPRYQSSITPTFAEQTANWTPAELGAYQKKLALARSGQGFPRPAANSIVPMALHSVYMSFQQQQTSYWCGPATVSMMLSSFGVNRSQSQAATDMGTTPSSGTSRPAMGSEMAYGNLQWHNYYVWQGVSSGFDVWSMTGTDIYSYTSPPAYNVVTNGVNGQPLWHWQDGNTYYHYFPAGAYDDSQQNVMVNDPWWPSMDWYSGQAIYLAIDNFWGAANVILW